MIAAATMPAPSIQGVRADVPGRVAELVDRALRFEANARWQDAREMQRVLQAIRVELPAYEWQGISPSGAPSGPATPEPSDDTLTTSIFEEPRPHESTLDGRRSSNRRAILAMVCALALAGGAVVMNLRSTVTASREPPRQAVPEATRRPEAISETTVPAPSTTQSPDSERVTAGPLGFGYGHAPRFSNSRPPLAPTAWDAARPAPPQVRSAPPPLEEFLDERR